jgi:ubiquinone/menaquinone biosynthesis C-methylase UbiE
MRERAAQELSPEMGRMGAEDPSRAFPAAPHQSVSFDRAAGYYDRTRALPAALMARLIPMLLAELPHDGRCLEIGIGTGRIALPLAREGVSIVGIDISREMLRRMIGKAEGSSPLVLVGDATRLPFGADSFASAIAAHVLHLIPAWKVAVEEMLRVVRCRGIILASRGGPSTDWDRKVRRHFFVEAGDPPWPPGVNRIEELDEHMRSIGVEVRPLPVLSTEGETSINAVIANLEAGYLSACWSLDESTRKTAAAATREWASVEFGDLDQPRTSTDSSVWHAYVVP